MSPWSTIAPSVDLTVRSTSEVSTSSLNQTSSIAGGVATLVAVTADDPEPPPDTIPAPQSIDTPRERSGDLAMQVAELDGDTHVYVLDDTDQIVPVAPDPDVIDTQPVWDGRWNRLAFTRDAVGDAVGSRIWYVVPAER